MIIEAIGIAALFLMIVYTLLFKVFWKKVISFKREDSREEKYYCLFMNSVLVGTVTFILSNLLMLIGEAAGASSKDIYMTSSRAACGINGILELAVCIPMGIGYFKHSIKNNKHLFSKEPENKEEKRI